MHLIYDSEAETNISPKWRAGATYLQLRLVYEYIWYLSHIYDLCFIFLKPLCKCYLHLISML
uniref:Uncharacterized protein n=1 Tax=Octopus bimaculoides TaxID=37653 RepID=A0A0L8HNH8_OCTBM